MLETAQNSKTTIDIFIVGVSIGYNRNENHHKVIFPWNTLHQINLVSEKNGKPYIMLDQIAKENRRIMFEISPNEKPCVEIGNYATDFIDLTGQGLHEALKFKENWRSYGVEMDIVGAELSVYQRSNDSLIIVDSNGKDILVFDYAGISEKATIQLEEGESLTLRILDEQPDQSLKEFASYTINYEPDTYYRMEFDNDCSRSGLEVKNKLKTTINNETVFNSPTDFILYYSVVEDAQYPWKHFSLYSDGDPNDPSNCQKSYISKVGSNFP